MTMEIEELWRVIWTFLGRERQHRVLRLRQVAKAWRTRIDRFGRLSVRLKNRSRVLAQFACLEVLELDLLESIEYLHDVLETIQTPSLLTLRLVNVPDLPENMRISLSTFTKQLNALELQTCPKVQTLDILPQTTTLIVKPGWVLNTIQGQAALSTLEIVAGNSVVQHEIDMLMYASAWTLTTLRLNHANKWLEPVLKCCVIFQNLTTLHIFNNNQLQEHRLRSISISCPQLKSLGICDCSFIESISFSHDQVEVLEVAGCGIRGLQLSGEWPKLRKVDLKEQKVFPGMLERFLMQHNHILDLAVAPGVKFEGSQLRKLTINARSQRVDLSRLTQLLHECKKLEELRLEFFKVQGWIYESKNLKGLMLEFCETSSSVFQQICTACPNLATILLNGCKDLNAPFLLGSLVQAIEYLDRYEIQHIAINALECLANLSINP